MKRDLAALFSLLLASSFAAACTGTTADGNCASLPPELTEHFDLTTSDVTCGGDAGVDASTSHDAGALACTCEELCKQLTGQVPLSCRFLSSTNVDCTVTQTCPGGRKPAQLVAPRLPFTDRRTAFLLGCAHMEAASVIAFASLASDLSSLGAPQALVDRVHAAADDEVRHARAVLKLAGRATLPAVEVGSSGPRDAFAIALENAREGCVRETYAALLAQRQGSAARDPMVRSAMAEIAADETRHAELSWTLAAWLDELLDADQRRAIADARACEASALRAELVSRGLLEDADLGLPSAREAVALLDGLVAGLGMAA